jgi:methyl-accepting chemotaxis protein
MTMSTAADLEQQLAAAYEKQLERYQQALATAEAVIAAFQAGQDATRDLEQLQASLDQVAEGDGHVRDARRQWDGLARQPGTRLRTAVGRLEQLLNQLIQRIHAAEQLARQARERLVPELNQEARSQQMRAAYASEE